MSHIGELFKAARQKAGLTRKEVALAAGYHNLNKGLRRLNMLEDGKTMLPNPRIVERFAAVLGIDEADIAKASARDWEELDRPIRPYLVERLMPAVYRRHHLPEDVTVADAREIASRMSIETGRSFCLVLSRVRCVYFYPSGRFRESHYVPNMSIGRRDAFTALSQWAVGLRGGEDHDGPRPCGAGRPEVSGQRVG